MPRVPKQTTTVGGLGVTPINPSAVAQSYQSVAGIFDRGTKDIAAIRAVFKKAEDDEAFVKHVSSVSRGISEISENAISPNDYSTKADAFLDEEVSGINSAEVARDVYQRGRFAIDSEASRLRSAAKTQERYASKASFVNSTTIDYAERLANERIVADASGEHDKPKQTISEYNDLADRHPHFYPGEKATLRADMLAQSDAALVRILIERARAIDNPTEAAAAINQADKFLHKQNTPDLDTKDRLTLRTSLNATRASVRAKYKALVDQEVDRKEHGLVVAISQAALGKGPMPTADQIYAKKLPADRTSHWLDMVGLGIPSRKIFDTNPRVHADLMAKVNSGEITNQRDIFVWMNNGLSVTDAGSLIDDMNSLTDASVREDRALFGHFAKAMKEQFGLSASGEIVLTQNIYPARWNAYTSWLIYAQQEFGRQRKEGVSVSDLLTPESKSAHYMGKTVVPYLRAMPKTVQAQMQQDYLDGIQDDEKKRELEKHLGGPLGESFLSHEPFAGEEISFGASGGGLTTEPVPPVPAEEVGTGPGEDEEDGLWSFLSSFGQEQAGSVVGPARLSGETTEDFLQRTGGHNEQ